MNDPSTPSSSPSPTAHIDEVCDAFESAWQRGQRPRIEDYLDAVDAAVRTQLLQELLLVELAYRRRRERPTADEYLSRFPSDGDVVRAAFREASESAGAPDDTARSRAGVDDAVPAASGVAAAAGLRFSVLRFHKEGGLGQVWLARDRELNREVALKAMKPSHADSPDLRGRFVVEAEITGRLEHPGVVPVYGLGRYPDGRPFYAMRFIRGESLGEAIAAFHASDQAPADPGAWRLGLRRLLQRFVDVCHTIDYAHSRGVIHRDLKPANIMLGEYGETLVVDWGLAKAGKHTAREVPMREGPLHPLSAEGSTPTELGAIVGTLQYMSPEQAAGQLPDVGAASDIYSLGATLYCLLTGQPPVAVTTRTETLFSIQKGKFPRPRDHDPRIPRALEAICLKAMAVRAQDRYASARELSEDMDRWLADEPVRALPERWHERLSRWARHHRTWVQAGTAFLVMIAAVAVVAAVLINQQRQRANEFHRQAVEREAENADLAISEARLKEQAEQRFQQARRNLYAAQLTRVQSLAQTDPGRALEVLTDATSCPEDLREFTWHYFYRACRRERCQWQPHPRSVRLAAFMASGASLVTVGQEGMIKFWNSGTAALEAEVACGQPVTAAAFNPAVHLIAVAHKSGTIDLWDAGERKAVGRLESEHGPVRRLVFSADGQTLVALHAAGIPPVVIWNVPQRQRTGSFLAPTEANALALADDGSRIAVGGTFQNSSVGGLKVWDVAEARALYDRPLDLNQGLPSRTTYWISALAFTQDAKTLVMASGGGVLAALELDSLDLRRTLAHYGTIRALALHSQGHWVATAGAGHSVRTEVREPHRPVVLWNSGDFQPQTYLAGIVGDVMDLSVSPDNRQLATTGTEGAVSVFDLSTDWCFSRRPCPGMVLGVAFSADGQTLAAVVHDEKRGKHVLEHWDSESDARGLPQDLTARSGLLVVTQGGVLDLRTDAERSHVPPEPADLIDAVTGQSLGLLSLPPPQRAVAVAPDRRTVAVLGPGQKLGLWDLPQQQIRHELWWPETATAKEPGPTDEAQLVRFSPDGRLLAWACGGAAAHVGFWDPATGEHQGSLEDLQGGVTALAFSADAQTLAVGQISGPAHSESQGRKGALTISISLWDVASGTQCTELKGHRGPIYALAFSPDGRTLASGSRDTTVRLWETRSGLELAALTGHAGTVFGVAFAPQGGLLATGAGDHTCCSWRATPERAVQEREAAQRVAELRGTLVLRSEILKQLGQDATLSEGVRREALRLASTLPDDVRRQAQHLVAQLSDRIPLKTEMLEAIRQQPQLAAGVREEALGLAHDLDDDPDRLNDASWRIAMAPQQTAAHYAAAERLMRIACSLRPDDWKLLNTLAVLLYRRGEFAQALATLRRSAELSTQAFGEPHPADVAFMAMTQFRLGEREAAQSNLQTLEKVAEQREWQNNDLLQLLLREATQVLHSAAEESCKPAP